MFYTHYTKDGKVFNSVIRKKDVILHREDGPALILNYDYGDKIIVRREEFRLDNKLHNENKPSIITYYDNKNIKKEIYCLNHKFHRENGPAHIEYDNNGKIEEETYYYHGLKHRIDGPAIIRCKYGKVFYFWFYKNKEYTKQVKNWILNNNYNSWKHITENDFNRMWMEIL